jgi:hypothetical protein
MLIMSSKRQRQSPVIEVETKIKIEEEELQHKEGQQKQDEVDCESAFITLEEMPEPWKSLMEYSKKGEKIVTAKVDGILIMYRLESHNDRVEGELVKLDLTKVTADHPMLQHPDVKKPMVIGLVTDEASFARRFHGKYCMNLLHTCGRIFSTPVSLGLHQRESNWTFFENSTRQ